MDDARREAGLKAVGEVLTEYRDVFGAQCWCADETCEGDCGQHIPATVGLSGFVVITEFADLQPDGQTATHWEYEGGPNRALGMVTRVVRRL